MWVTACEHIQSASKSGPWLHVPDFLGKKAGLTRAKGWHDIPVVERILFKFITLAIKERGNTKHTALYLKWSRKNVITASHL